jgi:hypothetical protein
MIGAVIGIIVVAGVIIVALLKWEHISKGTSHNAVTTGQSVRFPGGFYGASYEPTHLDTAVTFSETRTSTSITRSVTLKANGSASSVIAANQQFYAAARSALTAASREPLQSRSNPLATGRSSTLRASSGSRSLPPKGTTQPSPRRVAGRVIR